LKKTDFTHSREQFWSFRKSRSRLIAPLPLRYLYKARNCCHYYYYYQANNVTNNKYGNPFLPGHWFFFFHLLPPFSAQCPPFLVERRIISDRINVQAPNRTSTSCQEPGRHNLRFFSISQSLPCGHDQPIC